MRTSNPGGASGTALRVFLERPLDSRASMRRGRFRALALLVLVSCAPSRPAPVKVVVLKFSDTTRKYEPRTVELTTPTDIVSLEGPVGTFRGGAKFVLDLADPNLNPGNPETFRKAVTRDEGSPVKISWIDREGVLTPGDFHSLNLATTYYNIEQSFSFFEKVGGLTEKEFGRPNVYYFPDFVIAKDPEKDNAFYFSLIQGFLILPFNQLQQVPLSINIGVVGHEYSHAVFNYRVFNKDLLPRVLLSWQASPVGSPALNLLKSLDEGIADVFGTGITCSSDLVTCNPEFIALSLPAPHPENRRLDKPHCMTPGMKTALQSQNFGEFQFASGQYLVGSVLASSLWRATEDAEVVRKLSAGEARKQMFQGLYRSLAGTGGAPGLRELVASAASDQNLLRLGTIPEAKGVLDAIADGMTDPLLKASVCSAFLDRFGLTLQDLKSCPGTARSFNECAK